jgi:hypothetical protein
MNPRDLLQILAWNSSFIAQFYDDSMHWDTHEFLDLF